MANTPQYFCTNLHSRIRTKSQERDVMLEGLRQMKKLRKVLECVTVQVKPRTPCEGLSEAWNEPSSSDEGNDED